MRCDHSLIHSNTLQVRCSRDLYNLRPSFSSRRPGTLHTPDLLSHDPYSRLQNQDWHCDSGVHIALFWEHKEFQDRAIRLWEALAKRYKGNTWVAGYNPLNEPADPEQTRLQAWYERAEKAIRKADPDHILFLDGNTVRSLLHSCPLHVLTTSPTIVFGQRMDYNVLSAHV